MAESNLTDRLFHALLSTQGTLHTLIEDGALSEQYKAKVLAAIASNESILDEAGESKPD